MINKIEQESPAPYAVPNEGDAIIEQAKAILLDRLHTARPRITSTKDSENYCHLQLAEKDREVFAVLYLDSNNALIEYVELFTGTIDAATVYPREVVRKGLLLNATALILAHNHPSGSSKPSEADKTITRRIVAACGLVDMNVLDHIVVGFDCFSFAQGGLM